MEPPLKWATYDNPAKNSLEYHCVQHQKVEWLATAANMDQEADTFVWLDYGIMHLPGMNGDYLTTFLDKIRKERLCHPWLLAGRRGYRPIIRAGVSVAACLLFPRADVDRLGKDIQSCYPDLHSGMKKVSFEVNMLALVEQTNIPNLRWYEADHNVTMFTNYEPK